MAAFRDLRPTAPLAPCPNANKHADCVQCTVRTLSVCAALEPDEAGALEKLARGMCFDAHQTLFRQDEPANSVYNITSGAIRLSKVLPDGRCQVVGFALPGDFLGLAMSDCNVFSADALTATTVCQFRREAFSDLVDEKPHLLRRLHGAVSHELSLAHDQMCIIGRRTGDEKVAAFLVGLRERWSRIDGSSVDIALPMTRQDIADFLGLAIETVSRKFSLLAKQKVIVIIPGGVRVLDVAQLKVLAKV